MLDIIRKWVPLTYEAFEEFDLKSAHLSATALKVVRKMTRGEKVNFKSSGLPKREWDELILLLEL